MTAQSDKPLCCTGKKPADCCYDCLEYFALSRGHHSFDWADDEDPDE